MALTQGITGTDQDTDGATEELAFDATVHKMPCTTLMVRCVTGATQDALVRVETLHAGVAAGAGVRIVAGEREYFRIGILGVVKVYIGGNGGVTTVDWGPVTQLMLPSSIKGNEGASLP